MQTGARYCLLHINFNILLAAPAPQWRETYQKGIPQHCGTKRGQKWAEICLIFLNRQIFAQNYRQFRWILNRRIPWEARRCTYFDHFEFCSFDMLDTMSWFMTCNDLTFKNPNVIFINPIADKQIFSSLGKSSSNIQSLSVRANNEPSVPNELHSWLWVRIRLFLWRLHSKTWKIFHAIMTCLITLVKSSLINQNIQKEGLTMRYDLMEWCYSCFFRRQSSCHASKPIGANPLALSLHHSHGNVREVYQLR